jgi:starch synthase
MDPFYAFATYPSAHLTPQTLLALATADAAAAALRVEHYRQLTMVNFAAAVLPSQTEVQLVLEAASISVRPAIELIQTVVPERRALVFRALVWLVKLGVLQVYQPEQC